MDDAFRSGFASVLLDVLFNRLANLIVDEVNMIMHVDESLRKLETSMAEAQNQLNRVDHLQINDVVRRLADDVTAFCYDADDLIDDLVLEMKKQKRTSISRKPIFQAVMPTKNFTVVGIKILPIPRRIDDLQKRLGGITMDLMRNLDLCRSQPQRLVDRCTFSTQQFELVGRDADISFIVKKLTSLEENSGRNGVSIVGMRGLGKTTLAHAIVNYEELQDKFPLILSISMSAGEVFNREDMISKLVVVHDNRVLNGLLPKQLLEGEKWLILIDNLGEVPQLAWRDFEASYLTSIGRKVLITTLNQNAALVTQTAVHHLRPLSIEQCQKLITHESTHLHNDCAISPHVSNKLAKMSYGLPLIATFLGWSHGRTSEGSPSAEENLWTWQPFRTEILPIFESTYLSLKPYLKRCFAYFSLFPQGYHFDAQDLILLWMGEGFVQPHASRLEQNGWDHFNGLLEQSIIQPLFDDNHMLSRYEMHKFTHYFAQVSASKIYVHLGENASISCLRTNAYIRHLSSSQNISPHFWDEIKRPQDLRTFLSLYDSNFGKIGKIPHETFKKFSGLRVLSLTKTDHNELPESIGRLKRLRYLNVSATSVQKLPKALSNLVILQILKLKNDHGIPQLPKNFCSLTNLVFIDWDKGDIKKLRSLPSDIGKLTGLRTLPLFITGDKEGFHITELKYMEHLEGSICISNLDKVKDGTESKEVMLSNKSCIEKLELEWRTLRNDTIAEDVLGGLQPNDKLKELRIFNYGAPSFPQWLSRCDSLPMLHTLHLKGCHCQALPALGQLPSLKTLHLADMCKIIELDNSMRGVSTDGCFPLLKSLVITYMPVLQEWTGLTNKDMPLLCELKITNCPNLKTLPSLINLTSLVSLQIENCGAMDSLPDLPTSLQSLSIRDSNLLKTRCQIGGEDWSKVSRFVNVRIDGDEVPTSIAQPIPQQPRSYLFQGFESVTNSLKTIYGRLF